MVKNLLVSAGDTGDVGSVPRLRRSPGRGNGNPLQYSYWKKFHGQRTLAGYSPWDHRESDMTEYKPTVKYTSPQWAMWPWNYYLPLCKTGPSILPWVTGTESLLIYVGGLWRASFPYSLPRHMDQQKPGLEVSEEEDWQTLAATGVLSLENLVPGGTPTLLFIALLFPSWRGSSVYVLSWWMTQPETEKLTEL